MMSFRLLPCLLFLFAGPLLFAQPLDLTYFDGLKPRNIGPAGMSGRVTSIDVDLSNDDIIYVGTASGGVWKSTNGGINFRPIFDDQPLQAIGSVAVSQKNPSVIWVGTGEGNPRNSANYGGGIFRSPDGGATWQARGLEKTRSIHRLIVHPDDPNTVFAGAQGNMWGPNPERGVYRTRDGGATWKQVLYLDEGTGVADLVMDPTNPDKLIAALWTFDRDPWFFNSGGKGSGIFISYNGGDSWTRVTDKDGLPKGELGRIGLAIAPSKPNLVYALVEAKVNGLYKSTDGGRKWSLVSEKNIGNRPFYYADIYVDPQNENRIYNLWSYVSESEDGGRTFKTILDYGTGMHPDHHAFWVHPNDPDYLIEGNDGGMNISRDGGDSWRFVPNLPVAQFYHIDHDMDIPYNVAGGMQDNGSWVGPSQAWKAGGITVADWQEVFFGDGFDVSFKPDDNRYVYAMAQGGSMGLVDRETGHNTYIKPVHPEGKPLRFNWNAPLEQSRSADCTIYYGSQYVHKSTDCGRNWTIISPDLTTNDTTKQRQDISGGLTIDATQAENFTTLIVIAEDPFDARTIWAGSDDGLLHLTRDGGQNWEEQSARLPGVTAGSYIPYIELSSKNRGEAFLIVNDYRRSDFRPMAFRTTDYGKSWTRIVDENKVDGHALAIVQDPEQTNHLWLGTDRGLYFSLDYGQSWTHYTSGFPSVPVTDLKIHPREHDLVIGTFGRAAWILDDLRPFRALARERSLLQDSLVLFPPPTAYQANYRSYQGIRFTADGEYIGDNRPGGAMLTLWLLPKPGDKDTVRTVDKKETRPAEIPRRGPRRVIEDTGRAAAVGLDTTAARPRPEDTKSRQVTFKVLNAAGDTVRTFSRKLNPGMVRTYWNFERDGVAFPSRREPKPDADPHRGPAVPPGTYTILAVSGNDTSRTSLVVAADPRLRLTDYSQREALRTELDSLAAAAARAFDRLQTAEISTKRVDGLLADAPKAVRDTLTKRGKTLRDTIAKLEELFMEPADAKGIQRNPNNLNSNLYEAANYIGEVEGQPTQMAHVTLETARRQTREVVERINDFLRTDLAEYRREVDAARPSLFGELGEVELRE